MAVGGRGRFCTACGADRSTQAGSGAFCTACGARRVPEPGEAAGAPPIAPVAWDGSPPSRPATPAPRGSRGRRGPAVAVCVLALALVAAGTTWGLLRTGVIGGDDDAPTETAAATGDATSTGTTDASTPTGDEPTGSAPPATPEAALDPDDPLDLDVDLVDQSCDGQFLVVLASSGVPADYRSTLGPALDAQPDARYLATDQSCSTFNQEIDGNRIYAAYLGPFTDATQACAARSASLARGSYVRVLDTSVAQRTLCVCEDVYLPELSRTSGTDSATSLLVDDLQALLYRAGDNPDMIIDGTFGAETESMVAAFQRRQGLPADGVVDVTTSESLLQSC